MVEGRDRR